LAAIAKERGTPLLAVSGAVIGKLSDSVSPQPVVAVLGKSATALADLKLSADSFVLILDGLKDPGNVGTIIRTAAAAGIDAVILAANCADLFSPKTLRATMGAIFHLPVVTGDTSDNIAAWLKSHSFRLLAACAQSEPAIYQTDFSGRVAVALGSEAQGVGDVFLRAAEQRVSIPMPGRAESLNVAVAAALFIYQARGRG
jgi:TrmH family RNA methyltransferase